MHSDFCFNTRGHGSLFSRCRVMDQGPRTIDRGEDVLPLRSFHGFACSIIPLCGIRSIAPLAHKVPTPGDLHPLRLAPSTPCPPSAMTGRDRLSPVSNQLSPADSRTPDSDFSPIIPCALDGSFGDRPGQPTGRQALLSSSSRLASGRVMVMLIWLSLSLLMAMMPPCLWSTTLVKGNSRFISVSSSGTKG
jgi:hypothetical protein